MAAFDQALAHRTYGTIPFGSDLAHVRRQALDRGAGGRGDERACDPMLEIDSNHPNRPAGPAGQPLS
jgi:hypothetical protein